MVWNIPLVSLGQQSRLCALPQPTDRGGTFRESTNAVPALLSSSLSTGVVPTAQFLGTSAKHSTEGCCAENELQLSQTPYSGTDTSKNKALDLNQ